MYPGVQELPVTSQYDFVIVGGGSAGSALANRLSADAGTRVLVLEAGRSDYPWDVFVHMPAALAFPIGNRLYDWRYRSEPEPYMNGRRVFHARGKLLGGSSSINGMIFQRGNPMDYERWAADPGMETWDYAHCLPYFKRMETCLAAAPGDPFRGAHRPAGARARAGARAAVRRLLPRRPGGWLSADGGRQRLPSGGLRAVRPQRPPRASPFGRRCIPASRDAAAEPRGAHPCTDDADPLRGPARVGVEYRRAGRPGVERVRAGEVVLCGGAINSPQLLQLSGIGAAAELRRLGIDIVADLPGVGENLQDHLEVYVQHSATQPVTMAPYFRMRNRPAWASSGCCASRDPAPPTTSRRAASCARTTTSPGRT
jgi:choline dehydrogenase